jgi:hypothetical protein
MEKLRIPSCLLTSQLLSQKERKHLSAGIQAVGSNVQKTPLQVLQHFKDHVTQDVNLNQKFKST